MKRISIIQDAEESSDNAEESSDNDIILNCIEGDCSDDEDLPVIVLVTKLKITWLRTGPDTDSGIVDQDKYSDYNNIEPFIRLELGVSF